MASREIPRDWKKAHSHLQERQDRGPGELQASQSNISLQKEKPHAAGQNVGLTYPFSSALIM